MSPDLRVGRKTLSYPLWAVDFDPSNHDFLVVGGGGGSTSSGVPNKITLLDVSKPGDLHEIVDIELAKEEDSVTSLAIADSKPTSLTVFAGINSSDKDQEKGKNEHFRSFRIGLPSRKRTASGEEKPDEGQQAAPASTPAPTQALSRMALFRSATGTKNETYQRKLRVARTGQEGDPQIAAIASGLAPQNEVITFRVNASPTTSNIISRINLESSEAADLDLTPIDESDQSTVLAYCTDHEVFVQRIPADGKDVKEPIKVSGSAKSSSKIKCIRWIGSRYLVLLRNRPSFAGSEIEIIKTDLHYTQSQIVLVKRLHKATKSAIGLDICSLSARPTEENQHLIGVVGQDNSIEILVVDWIPYAGLHNIKSYTRLREVQPGPITGIRFSTFIPPSFPVSKTTRPQFVRVASVSATNVVVVHTLPLRPYPATSKTPGYLLLPPPETVQNAINIFVALLVVGITALCMQVFCEIRGVVPPFLHAQSWLSPQWKDRLAQPYFFEGRGGPVIPGSMPPIVEPASSTISSVVDELTASIRSAAGEAASVVVNDGTTNFLASLVDSQLSDDKMIVLRDDTHNPDNDLDVATELHEKGSETLDQLKQESVKKWEDLSHEQKRGWKKKLIDAGHWTEKEGEKIFKGILFSELGGLVGAVLQG